MRSVGGVRLVLWDIDGTLVDTAGHGRGAFGEAFSAVVGREADLEAVRMAGRTDQAITVALLEGSGVADAAGQLEPMLKALAVALEARRERIADEGAAKPGARAALEALAKRRDVVQSLLTGNIEPNAAVKLAAFGLERLVDLEIGGYGSDAHVSRSDLVAVAREKARRLRGVQVEPADTVLVGDTPLDIEAAHAAGARAVAVASGPYGADELERSGADIVLADLRDTAALVAAIDCRGPAAIDCRGPAAIEG